MHHLYKPKQPEKPFSGCRNTQTTKETPHAKIHPPARTPRLRQIHLRRRTHRSIPTSPPQRPNCPHRKRPRTHQRTRRIPMEPRSPCRRARKRPRPLQNRPKTRAATPRARHPHHQFQHQPKSHRLHRHAASRPQTRLSNRGLPPAQLPAQPPQRR